MTTGDAVKLLKKAGFEERNQTGSHRQFINGSDRFTLVYHGTKKEHLYQKYEKELREKLKNYAK